ncbi:G patch domain-containing protein 4 isoform X1 [Leptidea sinapis]|uniref:G patch domain-containing protein 4 isoform X1 n=1 Tax=Leptidea sinapis TaxID=189913 RepID=UPI0021267304|nr:G patch domain-containing protein 4 isoform X1 [Leptidea sinapis]
MDFARKQLEKYGWTDGKGLGKFENGISEALKPKLKRSVTGVGHDAAAYFTDHWWTKLYNKAANNVQVEEENGKTKKIKIKDDFEITNSSWSYRKKNKVSSKEEYQNFFVKKAILTSGGSKLESCGDADHVEETVSTDVVKLSDEELFAACGGRTAHKGARHGLRALGKLARIQMQEQLLLVQPKYNGYSHAKKLGINNDDHSLENSGDKTYKEKKNKAIKKHNNETCSDNNEEILTTELKHKKRKKKSIIVECDDRNIEVDANTEVNKATCIKSKKKKHKKEVAIDLDLDSENTEVNSKKKKKKKHKYND